MRAAAVSDPTDRTPDHADRDELAAAIPDLMAEPVAPWPPLPIRPGQTWRLD